MSFEIERDWITASGLRAKCLWVRGSHRCGYIRLPNNHPLTGVSYSEDADCLKLAYEKAMQGEIGKRGVITLFCAGDGKASPEIVFDVHGSLTYAGDLDKDGGWWFGFDCAHVGDITSYSFNVNDVERTEEYVVAECEALARQIVEAVPFEVSDDVT